MGWYVVETNPLCEQAVQDRITVLGTPTFLPRMRRLKRCHRRNANPYILIFPRYLFVQLQLPDERDLVGVIKRFQGVKSLLGTSAERELPLAVRDNDIAHLQALAAELSKDVSIENVRPKPLAKDTIVRILWAPLEGKAAKIEFDNGIRAGLLLLAAGVVSRISLPRELIEAA